MRLIFGRGRAHHQAYRLIFPIQAKVPQKEGDAVAAQFRLVIRFFTALLAASACVPPVLPSGGLGVSVPCVPVPCVPSVDSVSAQPYNEDMRVFTAVIERCSDTGLYVGFVPNFPGAHAQGETLEELHTNLREVLGMLLEDGEPVWESEFVGTQIISVPA